MRFKNFSFSKLFLNTRFSVFFAVVAAFFLWLSITIDLNDVITDTYEVSIENVDTPSWLGGQSFQVVSRSTNRVKVRVKGPVSVVSSMDDDDIEIVGSFNSVEDIKSGNYPVTLSVSNAGDFPGVTFTIEPQTVMMEIDMFTEKEFAVEAVAPKVTLEESLKDDMHISLPMFMDSKYETLKISGPNSKLELIDSVKAVVEKEEAVTKTKNYTANLKFYDKDGNEITDMSPYTFEDDKIAVVVLVQPKKTVQLVATFSNVEGNVVPSGSLSQETITIYGPSEVIDSLTKIELEVIDVSQVTPDNKVFMVRPVLPQSVHIDEVVHGDQEFFVTVTVSKAVTVPFI